MTRLWPLARRKTRRERRRKRLPTMKTGLLASTPNCWFSSGWSDSPSRWTLPSLALRVLPLHHHREPSHRAGDAGVEPALARVGEGEGFVEQHHVVPLRALRLVHGEHVAVVELLVALAHGPFHLLDAAGETLRPHRDWERAADGFILRQQAQRQDAALAHAALLHH